MANSELSAASFSKPHAVGATSPARPNAQPGSGLGDWADCGPNSPIWIFGLVLAFGFLAFSLLRTINLPWVEEDNWYGAVYSQAAHNNLRAGILASGGVPATLYFGPLPIPKHAFYVHHPTLLPLLVTGAFAVLGEAEWVARLVPITASLASVLLIWTLMRSLLGRRAAAISAAFFVTLPMELHYGDMVDFEPCLVMWMLAALMCLRRWDLSRNWKWAAAAVLSCQMALWMDWPGYLFVLGIAAGFLLSWLPLLPSRSRLHPSSFILHPLAKRPLFPLLTSHKSLQWALLLLGITGLSGVLFLLQIHHANAGAWEDLWNALRMRLGNQLVTNSTAAMHDAPQFSSWDWCRAMLHGMRSDFLLPPWIFALIGSIAIVRGWKASEGLRWCGMAAIPMLIAGLLYVVILRNESFIHDFATFYLIGALALLAGAGLEQCLRWREEKLQPRKSAPALAAAVLIFFVVLAVFGFRQAEAQRSQFLLLDGQTREPSDLVPTLGRELAKLFPEGTSILCNFDPYGTTLSYYAQRTLITNLMESSDWKSVIAQESAPLGGIVWRDAPGAEEIVASLPPDELRPYTLLGFRFVLWRALPRAR